MAKQSTDEILGMMRSMNTGPRAERKSTPQASNTAPIELMSQVILNIIVLKIFSDFNCS